MISAKEAREMYEKSNARIAKYLETDVEPHVLKAVEVGKCQCSVYIGAEPSYKSISPNPFQQSVIEELKKLGYRVRFGSFGEKYVPRGLADDHDGSGPEHTNYGFEISW